MHFIKLTDCDNDPLILNADEILAVERRILGEDEDHTSKAIPQASILLKAKDKDGDWLEYDVVDTVEQVWRAINSVLNLIGG